MSPLLALASFVALASTGLAFYFTGNFDPNSTIDAIGDFSLASILFSIFLFSLSPVISSVRFYVLSRDRRDRKFEMGVHTDNLASIVGGLFMLNIFGQSLIRSRQRRLIEWGTNPVIITIFERAIGLSFLFLLFVLGLALINSKIIIPDFDWPGIIVFVLFLFIPLVLTIAILRLKQPSVFKYFLAIFRLPRSDSLETRIILSLICTFFLHSLTFLTFLTLYSNFDITAVDLNVVGGIFVVMFAAAVPLSVAGFGTREIGAAGVWSLLGFPVEEGLALALMVGVTSLVGIVLNLPAFALTSKAKKPPQLPLRNAYRHVHRRLLLALSVFVAFLLSYNLRLDTGVSVYAVSLADPVAFVGIIMAIIVFTGSENLSSIVRVQRFFLWVVFLYFSFFMALIIGVLNFGFSEWAFIKRFLGLNWLLGYFALGVVAVKFGGHRVMEIIVYFACMGAVGSVFSELLFSHVTLIFKDPNWASLTRDFFVSTNGITAFTANRNQFAMLLSVCLGVAAFLCVMKNDGKFLSFFMGLLVFCLLVSGSRSGIIVLMCFSVFIYIFVKPAKRFFASGIVLPCLVLVYLDWFYIGVEPTKSSSLLIRDLTVFYADRWLGYGHAVQMWLSSPIFGIGLGGFYQDTLFEFGHNWTVHSSFLWVATEFGAVGFVLIFGPIAVFLWSRLRGGIRNLAAGDIGLVLVLFAFTLMSLFHDMTFQRVVWFFAGVFSANVAFLRDRFPLRQQPPPQG